MQNTCSMLLIHLYYFVLLCSLSNLNLKRLVQRKHAAFHLLQLIIALQISSLLAFHQLPASVSPGSPALLLSLAYIQSSTSLLQSFCQFFVVLPYALTLDIIKEQKHGEGLRKTGGSMCTVPFLDPLEADFEKVVSTKIVALSMLYHTS